jgi:hypothetical protein
MNATIQPGSRVIVYRTVYYKKAGEIVSMNRGLCVVRLDDGRVIDAYESDLELALTREEHAAFERRIRINLAHLVKEDNR